MVRINKIYTRTGDQGQTHLADGTEVPKDAPRMVALGSLDELNAFIGQARTLAEGLARTEYASMLATIQNELFDIGAEIAANAAIEEALARERISRLESWIDEARKTIEPLKSFVLPGGSPLNAALHVCRTVCRRAERSMIVLHREGTLPEGTIPYINRLSDLLFALARAAIVQEGGQEYLWKPGRPQGKM